MVNCQQVNRKSQSWPISPILVTMEKEKEMIGLLVNKIRSAKRHKTIKEV